MSNPFYLRLKVERELKNFLNLYPSKINLIEELYLKAIIESYPRVKTVNGINDFLENGIRNEFIRDFKNHNSLLKTFIQNKTIVLTAENQVYTSDLTQRTDIEFISSFHQHKFVVECKRLSSAESRYVHGRKEKGRYKIDGMEKFIHQVYSKHDEQASMLSFIVKGNVENIANNLKVKVKTTHPSGNMENFICKYCCNWKTSFQSEHVRIDKSLLHIYHLFFDFQK